MKRIIFIIVIAIAGCRPEAADEAPPPYALPDTAMQAQVFGEGTVSTEAPEFATTFSPDAKTVYFNRASDDRRTLQIYAASYVDGQWREATALPFSEGIYRDVDPFVSHDGERLYFSSDRPVEGALRKDFDIWYVEREDSVWGAPINPGPPLNTSDDEIFVTESRSGTLYFTVFTVNGSRSVHRAVRAGDGYEAPTPVRFDVPDSVALGNPAIAPDESFIIVASANLDGAGVDLYRARRRSDGTFARPVNLGDAINSPSTDFAPHVTRDQAYVFFTSERPGIVGEPFEGRRPGDLYIARLPSE